MDILTEIDEKDRELSVCYSIIKLQLDKISEYDEKIKHLESLLLHTPWKIKED